MKSIEYAKKYGPAIIKDASAGRIQASLELFDEVYAEIETISKTRNAVRESAIVSIVKEVNQKWNRIRKIIENAFTVCPIKEDAIVKQFIKKHPEMEEKLMPIRNKEVKSFDPTVATERFNERLKDHNYLFNMMAIGKLGENNIPEESITTDD